MFTRTRLATAAVVCLAGAAQALTAAEPSPSAFGRAGTMKARVPGGGAAAPLISRGDKCHIHMARMPVNNKQAARSPCFLLRMAIEQTNKPLKAK